MLRLLLLTWNEQFNDLYDLSCRPKNLRDLCGGLRSAHLCSSSATDSSSRSRFSFFFFPLPSRLLSFFFSAVSPCGSSSGSDMFTTQTNKTNQSSSLVNKAADKRAVSWSPHVYFRGLVAMGMDYGFIAWTHSLSFTRILSMFTGARKLWVHSAVLNLVITTGVLNTEGCI